MWLPILLIIQNNVHSIGGNVDDTMDYCTNGNAHGSDDDYHYHDRYLYHCLYHSNSNRYAYICHDRKNHYQTLTYPSFLKGFVHNMELALGLSMCRYGIRSRNVLEKFYSNTGVLTPIKGGDCSEVH